MLRDIFLVLKENRWIFNKYFITIIFRINWDCTKTNKLIAAVIRKIMKLKFTLLKHVQLLEYNFPKNLNFNFALFSQHRKIVTREIKSNSYLLNVKSSVENNSNFKIMSKYMYDMYNYVNM